LRKRATPSAVDAGLYLIEWLLQPAACWSTRVFEISGNRYRDRYGDPLKLDFCFSG